MKVCSDVPEMWDGLIKRAMKIEGWDTVSAYIRELIREDLKRKGLLGVKPENGEKEAVFEEG
ncbi:MULTISPECIES: hypothetical protein [unclassified Archaeoglobus]|jgi:hypothetical protein|uniref:hypothetical protein n=1 Tax=unclassified Archaeoglobus TaxID=2643606 RepID=UPI0025C4FBF7|nr:MULTISPECIES: hypothetical protein [unclassified Archaeoglobus]